MGRATTTLKPGKPRRLEENPRPGVTGTPRGRVGRRCSLGRLGDHGTALETAFFIVESLVCSAEHVFNGEAVARILGDAAAHVNTRNFHLFLDPLDNALTHPAH